jgi:uncharacterized protein with HEPN domain
VAGVDYESFRTNDEKVFAVVRALAIIGEAARHVPQSVRRRHPDIPWQDIAGMRSKLIHDYFGVDKEVVWRTVQEDVPVLQEAIAVVLAEIEGKTAES